MYQFLRKLTQSNSRPKYRGKAKTATLSKSKSLTLTRAMSVLAISCIVGISSARPEKSLRDGGTSPLTLTREILVKMHSGAFADALAQKYQIAVKGNLLEQPDWVVFTAYSVKEALRVEELLKSDSMVELASNNSIVHYTKYQAFTPNDPYYPFNSPIGTPGQWHLNPNSSGRPSVNVQGAWSQGIVGATFTYSVRIGIVDDGLQHTHPDLAPNYSSYGSFNFGDNIDDPSPVMISDNHGTAVAGVAAARGGNSLGVTGAAPMALLSGLKVNFGGATPSPESHFVNANLYKSSGAFVDRGTSVKNHSYGVRSIFVKQAASRAALETSAAAGTIHVISAGNERNDANKKDNQSSPGVICVAALGGDGKFADYSNYGANVFVTAPSSSANLPGITTTDRTGEDGYNNAANDPFPDADYTSTFGGTSSSSPLVAGVMALLKQRAPALDVRLAKHLLARTSKIVDPWDTSIESDGGWKTNGGGFDFNPNYGFGNIHATDLVDAAKPYYNAGPKFVRTLPLKTVNLLIAPNNNWVETTYFSGATIGGVPLEDIMIRLRFTHSAVTEIECEIISPFGTRHRLFAKGTGPGQNPVGNVDWTFTTNAFWGENPMGTWKLRFKDSVPAKDGQLNDYTVIMNHGAPATRVGSNILTYNTSNVQQMNAIYNGKSYFNQALPNKPAGAIPVAIGDVTGDRRNDILYVLPNQELTYLRMWGYESMPAGAILGNLAANQKVIGISNMNQDGFQDVVIRNTVTNEIGYRSIALSGQYPVLASTFVVIGTPPSGMIPFAVADFTGDGQPDIAMDKTTVARSMIIWQLSPGGSPYGFLFSGYQATGFNLIGLGDFNYDFQPDFVALNASNGSVAGYNMNLLTVTTVATLTTIPAGHTAFGAAAL